jgi:hypothetical protein
MGGGFILVWTENGRTVTSTNIFDAYRAAKWLRTG